MNYSVGSYQSVGPTTMGMERSYDEDEERDQLASRRKISSKISEMNREKEIEFCNV